MSLLIKNIKRVFSINQSELEVLRDITLDVEEGKIISIVGSSGCGKSTLLKIIVGLDKATEGEIYIDNKKIVEPSKKDVGIIFQEPRLFPWSTVEKNIEFGISTKLSKKEKKQIIKEHIDLVGLNGFENALPSQLSGGMQQRVSIARTLINHPRVLLLDEPFGALDAFTKLNMQQEVLKIWQHEKTTMILVTHDIDEAIYLGDKVVVMSSKPGVIKNIVSVELSRPRDRTNDDFAYLRKKIYDEFFEKQEKQLDYYL